MDKIAKLQKEWEGKLRLFAYQYVRSYPIAEDLVQDVFLKLIESDIDPLQYENIGSFLYTILKNKCIDYIKHKIVEKKYLYSVSEMNYLTANCIALEDESIQLITDNEINKMLREAIMSLPDLTREVFILNKFKKKKYKEIAQICGISERAVEYQMSKATAVLKKILGPHYIFLIFLGI